VDQQGKTSVWGKEVRLALVVRGWSIRSGAAGPFCIYPWFTRGSSGFHYGVDYPDTINDYGQADQFTQTTACPGPFGASTTYCSTLLP
jgi:hypothetical protein